MAVKFNVGDRVTAIDKSGWFGHDTYVIVKDFGGHFWVKSEQHGVITDAYEDEIEPCTTASSSPS